MNQPEVVDLTFRFTPPGGRTRTETLSKSKHTVHGYLATCSLDVTQTFPEGTVQMFGSATGFHAGDIAMLAGAAPALAAGDTGGAGAAVYWGNSIGTTVGRANLDGTEVNQSFVTGVETS